MSDKEWDEFYMGRDGDVTYYIDMVEEKFAKSSTAPFDKRFPLIDNVDDMFKTIRFVDENFECNNMEYQVVYTNDDKNMIITATDTLDKPLTIHFDNSDERIIKNNDGSLYFVQKVPLEWVLNQVNDEDKQKINKAIENSYLLGEKVSIENVTLNSVYR